MRIGRDIYDVQPGPTQQAEVIKAWRLTRNDGTAYVVADTIDGASCECADHIFHHMGVDQKGCKHIKALREKTLIDPEGNSPEEWPAWTDTHAYTSR
jgi:hypothetical protein